MPTLREQLERLRGALPSPTTAVTLTRADLDELLGRDDHDNSESPSQLPRDLTVEEVAEHFHRSPSTVRHWLGRGELRGYKLNGRDWRIPRPALAEYEQAQREGLEPDTEDVDITEWRRAS